MINCTEFGEKTEKYMEFRQGEICYDCLGTDEQQPKIRVYAINGCDDVHEIEDEDFMNQAEDLGYVWSLLGFQNFINGEGNAPFYKEANGLHFRFIDIERNTNTPSMDKIQDLLDMADEIKDNQCGWYENEKKYGVQKFKKQKKRGN